MVFGKRKGNHFSVTYAVINFIEISEIGFPGNLVKFFMSSYSASLIVSETVFELGKNLNRKIICASESSLSISNEFEHLSASR